MFSADDTAADNAKKFLEEMDPLSLVHVTDLFRSEMYKSIAAQFGPDKIEKMKCFS